MKKGFEVNGIRNYTSNEAYELCKEGAVLVDVREEYMNGHKCFDVKKLIFSPFSEIEEQYQSFDRNEELIFADAAGLKSIQAARFFKEKGIANVANMSGGLVEWERNGLPLLKNIKERLSGSCMCQIKYRDIDRKS